MKQKLAVAETLLKLTDLRDHPAVAKFNLEINQCDWESFSEATANRREYIILEVFRFLIVGSCSVGLAQLLELNDDDYEAVTLCLHSASRYFDGIEENITK